MPTQKSPRIAVIGAGVGGLATAIRLAHRGAKVTVFEKTDQIGGRNRRLKVGEAEFDSGPSLMMMLDPFRSLFRDVGERMEDHLEITLCDPSYRVFYRDGDTIDGTPNAARMIEQLARWSQRDSDRYAAFLGEIGGLYHEAVPNFVRKNFRSILDFGGPKGLSIVLRRRMLGNLGRRVENIFESPKSRMLFSFQTMYLGLSPFDAPWVYAVLTYMEYGEGIWYPKGGLVAINDALEKMALQRGVEFRVNTEISRVAGKQLHLACGGTEPFDAIVCNADLPYAEKKLQALPEKKRRYSCSAQMFYFDYRGELPHLEHHNVFFGTDFRGNLEQIFRAPLQVPDDPAFYVCISSKTDPGRAAQGGSNVMVLVPCPNLDRPLTAEETQKIRSHVLDRLCQSSDFDPVHIAAEASFGPQEWADRFHLDRGAAFGLSHDFLQSAFFRPGNRSRQNPDLYFVGASTVPGNGLPMVLISAELVEDRLQRDGVL